MTVSSLNDLVDVLAEEMDLGTPVCKQIVHSLVYDFGYDFVSKKAAFSAVEKYSGVQDYHKQDGSLKKAWDAAVEQVSTYQNDMRDVLTNRFGLKSDELRRFSVVLTNHEIMVISKDTDWEAVGSRFGFALHRYDDHAHFDLEVTMRDTKNNARGIVQELSLK